METAMLPLVVVAGKGPSLGRDEELQPFASRSAESSVHDSCLFWGTHVVVPPQGHKQILAELHSGHLGVSRMKEFSSDVDAQDKVDGPAAYPSRESRPPQQLQM